MKQFHPNYYYFFVTNILSDGSVYFQGNHTVMYLLEKNVNETNTDWKKCMSSDVQATLGLCKDLHMVV